MCAASPDPCRLQTPVLDRRFVVSDHFMSFLVSAGFYWPASCIAMLVPHCVAVGRNRERRRNPAPGGAGVLRLCLPVLETGVEA